MKKGDILEATIVRTDFPNRGIAYIDDYTIELKNGLAGQTVRFFVQKKRRNRITGRILEVLKAAPYEQEPACEHFGECGGCNYQNLPYKEQLRLKREQVERLMEKGGFKIEFETVCASPIREGYRNKMEYTFGDEYKDGPLSLGMHKRDSFYDIVRLRDCRIVDEDFNIILQAVLEYFTKRNTSYYHRMRHEGFLRHLVLRRSVKTGDILLNLITSSQGELDNEDFVQMLLALPVYGAWAGILHTINDSVADVVKSDETRILYGQDWFYEYLEGIRFKISPFSFFQTNTLGAEVLYHKVREYVGDTKDKLIYDLYTGTGTIAQMLAPVAGKVIGVEIVEEAVDAARENAKANGLSHCEFIAGDVLEVLDSLTKKPDILILDPPRDGINPKALKKIIKYGVDEMVYVSCKPTSLVRDLAILREAGYEVQKASLVDMFPGTVHCECVCLLDKKKPKDYVEIGIDAEDYYRIKASEVTE